MDKKIIELELRAEVSAKDKELLKKSIKEIGGVLYSQTKRLSVMCFGNIGTKKLDVRIRITNGKCEVVIKSGSFGSHNRIEMSQKINLNQFLGMVKIFAQFDFAMEIGERETFNYKLHGDIIISVVSAGPFVYAEFEKMSSKYDVNKNNEQLKKNAEQLKLQILSEEEFTALCKRLTEKVDQPFYGTTKDYEKLVKLVNYYTNYKNTAKQL